MSAEYDAAVEICGKLEEIRQQLYCISSQSEDELTRLRRLYAGMAMQALVTLNGASNIPGLGVHISDVAAKSVKIADALIAALDS